MTKLPKVYFIQMIVGFVGFCTPVISFTPFQLSSLAKKASNANPPVDIIYTRLFETTDSPQPSTFLDPKETAVLFCKFQNDFAAPGGLIYETVLEVVEATNMLENSKALMEYTRKVGCTIVHCPISLEPGKDTITTMPFGVVERIQAADALKFGTWGAKIVDGMRPVQGDLIVPKYGMCAFSTTNLHEQLQERNIKNVIVVGFLTNGSVESTIRTAYERSYNVFTLPECCAACSMEEQIFSVNQNFALFARLADLEAIMEALDSKSKDRRNEDEGRTYT